MGTILSLDGLEKSTIRIEEAMVMKITLEPRWIYGRLMYFPRCTISECLARLGNTRRVKSHTLSQEEVDSLKAVGFRVKLVASEPKTT